MPLGAAGWAALAGTVGGALISADAAGDAADTQAAAANEATQRSDAQYQQTRADQAGYRARGNAAGDRLAMLLGLNPQGQDASANFDAAKYIAANPDAAQWLELKKQLGEPATAYDHYVLDGSRRAGPWISDPKSDPLYGSLTKIFTGADLEKDPGYQFGLKQGTSAIERGASSRGGLFSGATLKALQRYGTDYGGTKFGEAFNRDQINKSTLYNQLAGVAGTGQVATQATGAAGANAAANAAEYGIGAANAGAASSLAQANILQNGINQGLSMWQRQQKPATPGASAPWGGTADDPWYG